MKRVEANVVRAGVFIMSGIIFFALGVMIVSGDRGLFTREEGYFASFKNVSGLSEGAPVRLGGINVGRVADIGYGEDLNNTQVQVVLLINSDFTERVREDSVVSIETQGLLGDKFIAVSAGNPTLPAAVPGSILKSREPADLANVLSKTQTIIDNASNISSSLSDALAKLDDKTFENISAGARGFATLAKAVDDGDGLFHRLMYSKTDADRILGSVTDTVKSLEEVANEIKHGKGFLHSIIYEETSQGLFTNLSKTAVSLAETADLVSDILKEVQTGKGLAHQLVYDESVDLSGKINEVMSNLDQASKAIKRAASALANGDGTIGALLVDSQLYDNLVEVTDGAKRSFLLRQAIRSSMKDKLK